MIDFKRLALISTRRLAQTIAATPLLLTLPQNGQAQMAPAVVTAKICRDWEENYCSIANITSTQPATIVCAANGNIPVLVGPPHNLMFKRCALPIP